MQEDRIIVHRITDRKPPLGVVETGKILPYLPPILVVDDQPEVGTEIRHSLIQIGIPVDIASDALEALDRFKALKYSMIITDDQLPGVDGIQMLNSVKKISLQIPAIIMNANGTVNNAVAAMPVGACDYILKPFSSEVIERKVKMAMGSSLGGSLDGHDAAGTAIHAPSQNIITHNPELMEVSKRSRSIAPSKATVLIQDGSGTGKELLAAYVHRHGLRPDAPYVALNCAALPDPLLKAISSAMKKVHSPVLSVARSENLI